MLSLNIKHLTSDHAKIPSSNSELPDDLCLPTGVQTVHQVLPATEFKGHGEERISCQNCHGFPKHFMAGRFASSVIVVIHGWKIIMNQGVRMNEFG